MQLPCSSTTPTTAPIDRPINWEPYYDLRVGERDLVAFVDLPGVNEDELQIEVNAQSLVVEGDRDFDHDLEDAEEFTKIGRPYGAFRVEIHLSESINPDGATAKYRRGVLRIRMPIARHSTGGRRVHL